MIVHDRSARLTRYYFALRITNKNLDGSDSNRLPAAEIRTGKSRENFEKNVHDPAALERNLIAVGLANFRFLIRWPGCQATLAVGQHAECRLHRCAGGKALARAYANMDVLAFLSRTTSHGNVVLEALAFGAPAVGSAVVMAVVTNEGGPRFMVRSSETGFVADRLQEFRASILHLATWTEARQSMGAAARVRATTASWETVFGGCERSLRETVPLGKKVRMWPRTRVTGPYLG
jgi:glycosyltransferase involved in cell wall biosynthesis